MAYINNNYYCTGPNIIDYRHPMQCTGTMHAEGIEGDTWFFAPMPLKTPARQANYDLAFSQDLKIKKWASTGCLEAHLAKSLIMTIYYMAELVHNERVDSGWFPERSEFCYMDC